MKDPPLCKWNIKYSLMFQHLIQFSYNSTTSSSHNYGMEWEVVGSRPIRCMCYSKKKKKTLLIMAFFFNHNTCCWCNLQFHKYRKTNMEMCGTRKITKIYRALVTGLLDEDKVIPKLELLVAQTAPSPFI